MSPAELRALILERPENDPIRVAFLEARDEECAELLRAKTIRGPVPIVELSAYCTAQGITGRVETMVNEPTSETNPIELKVLYRTVLTLIRDDYRLTTADVDSPQFQAACLSLIGVGMMTAEQHDFITALAVNRSCVAEGVSANAVGMARNFQE